MSRFKNEKGDCNFRVISEPVCVLLKRYPGVKGTIWAGSILTKKGDMYIRNEPFMEPYPYMQEIEVSIPAEVVEDYNNNKFFKLIQPRH